MSAENAQGPTLVAEKTTDSGLIVPGRESSIRETISLPNLGEEIKERSATYNTPGVNPEDPYNAFYQGPVPEVSPEVAEAVKAAAEYQPAEKEVLEHVATSIDDLEKENVSQDELIDGLNEKLSQQEETIRSLEAQLADLNGKIDTLLADDAKQTEAEPERELHEKQPRRSRLLTNGVVEELVRYADDKGDEYAWRPVSERPVKAQEPTPTPGESKPAEKTDTEPKATALEDPTEPKEPSNTEPVPGKEIVPVEGSATEKEPTDTPGKEIELFDKSDSTGKEVELYESPEYSAELETAFSAAAEKYAQETAKHRNGYIGHFLHNSKYLAKITPLKKAAEWANERFGNGPLLEAREAYHRSVHDIQTSIFDKFNNIEDTPESKEAMRVAIGLEAVQRQFALESRIVAERTQQSNKTNKFVNWWTKQEGLKGNILRGLVVGGTGVAIGVGMGLAATPPIAALLAGGAAGLAIVNHINKRRANSVDAEGQTLAERQSEEDRQKVEALRLSREPGQEQWVEDLTSVVEDRTAAEKKGNRDDARRAASIGAAGAILGSGIGSGIRDAIIDATNQQTIAPKSTAEPGGQPAAPEAPKAPEILGNSFNIEDGNGYINELMDFAGTNGHPLDAIQAEQLHNDLLANFGQQYSSMPTYVEGADVRLAAPGQAAWNPGVSEFVQNWMSARGLW